MEKKIRGINYSLGSNVVVNRTVGAKREYPMPDGSRRQLEISRISIDPNEKTGIPTFHIFLSNGKEEACWRSVTSLNREVEYDILELL